MNQLTLFNQDCLDVVETLEDQSIDLVLIDPPYRNTISYAVTTNGNEHFNSKQSPFFFFVKYLFQKLKTKIKPTGHLICFCDKSSIFEFHHYNPGFNRFCVLFWQKQLGLGFGFRPEHEMMLAFCNKGAYFKHKNVGQVFKYPIVPPKKRIHPAQKPVDLLKKLIDQTTPENGVVVDFFMGSGATGEAALSLGHSFIGCEIEDDIFLKAKKRLEALL